MVLPGAVAPTPEGGPQAPPAAARAAKPKAGPAAPAHAVVPSPAALAGKTLSLNGGKSQMTFVADDKQLTVTRLSLAGEMISNSRAACQVDSGATSIATTAPRPAERRRPAATRLSRLSHRLRRARRRRPGGAARPDLRFHGTADCRVDPAGLWGPTPAELGPARDKEIERARGHAEAAVRGNYKALTASTKDRPTVMGFAREQAQFSSTREETCRGYAAEGQHGFCAMKLTEARAADLRAKLETALIAKAARKAKHRAGHAAER